MDYHTNEYSYTFINKVTGKETQVRASDVELATLRAWQISKCLIFKVPQATGGESYATDRLLHRKPTRNSQKERQPQATDSKPQ